jgi:hypothetical protein
MRFLTLTLILVLAGCVAKAHNLDSWSQSGDANWVAIEGIIRSTNQSGTGFLVSPRLYDDFELKVEFKPDVSVNAGVLIRCQDPDDIALSNCYEINIWDQHPNQDYRTGSIVIHSIPPLVHLNSVGKWNQYRIIAIGNKLSVWLNEQLTAEMNTAEFSGGHIALQSVGGEVQFRNLSIKTLTE